MLMRSHVLHGILIGAAGLFALSACSGPPRPEADIGQTTYTSKAGLQALVPSNPMMIGYPRLDDPAAPETQMETMPASEAECRSELKRIGVRYRDIERIDDGPSCGIAWPVEVTGLSGGIEMTPKATLSCPMALQFARWTKNELAPSARRRYFTGIKAIHQASSYSCRRIRTSSKGTMSAHSTGDALDVARIELDNGRDIDIRKPGWFAFRQRGLLNTVRADACDYFTTVLGPGYNPDHADHFHFDLMHRANGRKSCR